MSFVIETVSSLFSLSPISHPFSAIVHACVRAVRTLNGSVVDLSRPTKSSCPNRRQAKARKMRGIFAAIKRSSSLAISPLAANVRVAARRAPRTSDKYCHITDDARHFLPLIFNLSYSIISLLLRRLALARWQLVSRYRNNESQVNWREERALWLINRINCQLNVHYGADTARKEAQRWSRARNLTRRHEHKAEFVCSAQTSKVLVIESKNKQGDKH